MTDKQLVALTKKAMREVHRGIPLKDYMDHDEIEAALDLLVKMAEAKKGEAK